MPAIAAVALATVLVPSPIAVDLGFLFVVFVAVYVRRFGPRYTAFGMVAFIAYYIGQILHPNLSMLPFGLLAVTVATIANLLARFVLMPPRPRPTLRRVVASIRQRIARMLGDVARVLGSEKPDPAACEALRRHLARLKEAVLMAEDQIAALNPSPDQSAVGSQLGLRLFALELAAERLVQLAFELPPAPDRPATRPHRPAAAGPAGPATGAEPDARSATRPLFAPPAAATAAIDAPDRSAHRPGARPVAEGAGGNAARPGGAGAGPDRGIGRTGEARNQQRPR